MPRPEQNGSLRVFLIGGPALEAHGVVRFTKDVDFHGTTEHIPAMSAVLTRAGYRKTDENTVFARWKHPALTVDDVDVLFVSLLTFNKLMEGSVIHQIGKVGRRVPSMASLIALKLHAIRSNPERLEKDGRDIAELLLKNPRTPDKPPLETLFAKYGCSPYFTKFSRLVS